MGATALAAPIIGFGIATVGALATWAVISNMMSQAGSMSDGGVKPDGTFIMSPKGSVQVNDQDSMIVGTNLMGGTGGGTAGIQNQKNERREDRQLVSCCEARAGVSRCAHNQTRKNDQVPNSIPGGVCWACQDPAICTVYC